MEKGKEFIAFEKTLDGLLPTASTSTVNRANSVTCSKSQKNKTQDVCKKDLPYSFYSTSESISYNGNR